MLKNINKKCYELLMKKGKSVKLNLYKPIKTIYGTVDSKNLKSLYINIQSWVSPKKNYDNWNRVVSSLSRDIKMSVYNSIDINVFKERTIVDLDLRTSGLSQGKKSFMNLEVNLYTNEEIDFKSNKIKDSIRLIIKNIFEKAVEENKYFEFSLSKKE